MATFIDIDDPADPRLADYVNLRDVNLRKSLEAEHGLFIAEGAKVIRRACEAGYPPRSFLLAPRWIDGLRDLFDGLDVEVFVVSETLAEQVTGFHVHRGALASMCRQTRWSAADLMAARRLVVCEDIVDHTNVGAIIGVRPESGGMASYWPLARLTRSIVGLSRPRWGRFSVALGSSRGLGGRSW